MIKLKKMINLSICFSSYPCRILRITCRNNNLQYHYPYGQQLVGILGEPSTIINDIKYNYEQGFLCILWLSIIERRCYICEIDIENIITSNNLSSTDLSLLIGILPLGRVCVWLYNTNKSEVIYTQRGSDIHVDVSDYIKGNFNKSIDLLCDFYLNSVIDKDKKLMDHNKYIDNLTQKYNFRYLVDWGEPCNTKSKCLDDIVLPNLDNIEESLFDGTFDKLHDDGLLKYHKAGKPKKLAIKWHIKKSEYTAYFWFEDEKIGSIFERFYGAHPDTKTDFIIRIDAEQKKYELALFRQGLKEPQIIPEDAYQLLVFKNKFEHYRSDNYNQERGAWIW